MKVLFLFSLFPLFSTALKCHSGSTEYKTLFDIFLKANENDNSYYPMTYRSNLRSFPKAEPKILIDVLKMVELSYTGHEDSDDMEDWELVNTKRGLIGLNSLAYKHKNTNELIITFRGTTSLNDECADLQLWSGYNYHKNISDTLCHLVFSRRQLDYVEQAKTFVGETLSKHCWPFQSNCVVLFTGHSLGAALSQIMAYFYPIGSSVSFSSPGVSHLVKKYGLSRSDNCILEVNNPYDPVVAFTKPDQVGDLCELQGFHEPLSCRECYSLGTDVFCDLCFKDTHILSNYLTYFRTKRLKTKCHIY